MEDKMKLLQRNREEALAAHELARNRIVEQRRILEINFHPIWKRRQSVVRLTELKDDLSQEDEVEMWRTFKITEVFGPVTYWLKLLMSWWIHNVFHATILRPYKQNEVYGEIYTEPPPQLLEGEEVYEIETILNDRK
jgi:hypothetical protein